MAAARRAGYTAAMFVVLSVAMPVFGLILTGALASRFGLLGREVTGALNLFVVYLSLPAVLFQAMAHIHLADLAAPGMVVAYSAAIAVPFVAVLWHARRQGRRLGDGTMQALAATYANVGYMGIPLCRIAYGDAGLVPAIITLVITACPQFAIAVVLLEADRDGPASRRQVILRVSKALLRNPLLIAPLAGLAVAGLGIDLPLALDRYLTLLGGGATPCALVAGGMMVAESSERFRPGLVVGLVMVKLVAQPLIAWALAVPVFHLPPVWAKTAVVMSALPTGSGAFILARLYARDISATSGTVLVSTILSAVTLSVALVALG
jgi:predicted permease